MTLREKIKEIKEELYYDLYLNNEFIYDLVANIRHFLYELPFWLKIKKRVYIGDKIKVTYSDTKTIDFGTTTSLFIIPDIDEKKEV